MDDFLTVFIPFLLIHMMADFYLQPNQWIAAKKQHTYRSAALYYHSLLHGVLLTIPALILELDWRSTICLVTIVAISHFVIDLWKVTRANGDDFSYFVIDQTLHICVLIAIAFHMTDGLTISNMLAHKKFSAVILIGFAYLLVLKPTSIIISAVLKNYPIPENNPCAEGIVSGGKLIGYLERMLILTFTLVGSYAAVGFVLAAKSIFRFGELNKQEGRSMTEYVLIGSLVSVVFTTLLGTLVSLALGIKIK
ncbi:DUF3307 domain-containing protein [Pseudoalteromonas sp. JBTF-M23]|uniref:DUF3307 domain-containing protein n=1 Tax=Pseudoalteromonas caenipelagi TaxID=2726988 RepID=A0A849VHW9_9GAMM|nr:DUF3307 domain-containing protein [Pseudoalteromonas caenipelagi]NOU51444.1 DUF3307 domain-containing protein [Pseudoalteromonas caenipelagi]